MKYRGSLVSGCLLALALSSLVAPSGHTQTVAPAQTPTPAPAQPSPSPAARPATDGGQAAAPPQVANTVRGQNFEVRVSRVVAFSVGDSVALSVDYDYEFLGRETVYIKGFGVVPARGSLKYLTPDGQLVFQDAPGGKLLATIPLTETLVLQGAAFDVPSESDLSATAREELWTGRGLFANHARSVLNASFPVGFVAADSGGTNVWTTHYTRLSDLSNCLIGEVAVSVSHPINTPNGMLFRVRSAARERRCMSLPWRAPSQEVRAAAESFVTKLVQKMK